MTSLAAAAALALAAGLAGCAEARRTLAAYPVAESPGVAAAAYPRLVDMPGPAESRAAAPDPEVGAAVAAALRAEAAVHQAESARLSAPVAEIEPRR